MGYATAGPMDSAAQLPRHPVAEPSATLSRQMATDLTANSLNPLGGSRNPHGSLRDTGGGDTRVAEPKPLSPQPIHEAVAATPVALLGTQGVSSGCGTPYIFPLRGGYRNPERELSRGHRG